MAIPRNKYVHDGEEGVYHCFDRCVRRAFLYGRDLLTGRDFSHRKVWIVDRLRYLAAIFALEVCAYCIMENHYHLILRTRPDIVAAWSDYEVARRWFTICPKKLLKKRGVVFTFEEQVRALADCPALIAEYRKRLSSLSWFMAALNEFIARAANKEDEVKGRFWESRYKAQVLLDEAAIASCMVYVDLNPIRAGRAGTPEECDFTSIQERIRAWQKENTTASIPAEAAVDRPSESVKDDNIVPENSNLHSSHSIDDADVSALWLCPIESDSRRRGILRMTTAEYFNMVDRSGRMTRLNKRGAIDPELSPILLRIGANPGAWAETISSFGSRFRLAAGLVANLRRFADQLGHRWLMGVAKARVSFIAVPSQLA